MEYRIEPDTPSFSENMQDGLAQSGKQAAVITGALALGSVALGVAAVKNRRVRLKLVGAIHFPVSFLTVGGILFLAFVRFAGVGEDGRTDALLLGLPWILLVAATISVIWSILFIKRYIRPKLKEIDDAPRAVAAATTVTRNPDILYPPGRASY